MGLAFGGSVDVDWAEVKADPDHGALQTTLDQISSSLRSPFGQCGLALSVGGPGRVLMPFAATPAEDDCPKPRSSRGRAPKSTKDRWVAEASSSPHGITTRAMLQNAKCTGRRRSAPARAPGFWAVCPAGAVRALPHR